MWTAQVLPTQPVRPVQYPDLGVYRIDTYRSPIFGSRLIGTNALGRDQAVLSIVSINGTYLSHKTNLAVDQILKCVSTAEYLFPRRDSPG